MREARGLVLAPFNSLEQPIISAIRKSLGEIGIQVYRFDDAAPGVELANDILDAVRAADLLVVDVTQPNPNVFYELGYAHALRKPTILIRSSQSRDAMPYELQGLNYIMYDADNLAGFSHQLKRLSTAVIQRDSLV